MQFSMIFEAQMANPTAEHERQVILDSVEQAVYAEEMGFDRVLGRRAPLDQVVLPT
ncbi:hypothetical protein ACU686_17660 [Yinghuangia aomiensis]